MPNQEEKDKLDALWYDAESAAKGLAWLFLFGIGGTAIVAIGIAVIFFL
jgi:hypothetical protein